MPTTYGIKELSVILDIEIKARPLYAFFELFVDERGALIIGYAIDSDGFWLQIHKECITEKRLIESWTGYDIFDCCHKKIEGYEGHLYGLLPNCSPMLPAIFTAQQFSDFLMHTTIIRGVLDRGDETQVWLDDLAVSNPKAAELANLVLYGVMPKEDGVSEPDDMAERKPVQRSAAQNLAILDALKTLDVNPLAIPKNASGKSGVKAAVRKKLVASRLFLSGSKVFDKAWARMSATGDIVICK